MTGIVSRLGTALARVPLLYRWLGRGYVAWLGGRFAGSRDYWERRYSEGGASGPGSVGASAAFKAGYINRFVATHGVRDAIELGCGDGSQLAMLHIPSYVGFDVSDHAIAACRERFAGDSSKRFERIEALRDERADLAMSLDVAYHLVEDAVFHEYMRRLFAASREWVIVFSSSTERQQEVQAPHVRHRDVRAWISAHATEFGLFEHVPSPLFEGPDDPWSVDFFTYRRTSAVS